jgi:hypothetical protein
MSCSSSNTTISAGRTTSNTTVSRGSFTAPSSRWIATIWTIGPAETAGVVVLSAPDERGLRRLLERVNQDLFHDQANTLIPLPLECAKLQVFPEFGAGQR